MVTLPNALSALRLLGVPVFLWLVLTEHDGPAVLVLMVSGVTDYLDGKIARAWGQTSKLGTLLDPAADRLYILATLIGLTVRDVVPLWLDAAAGRPRRAAGVHAARAAAARLRPAARELPRQGRDVQPAGRLPAAAAR